jgi:hypothetical protein
LNPFKRFLAIFENKHTGTELMPSLVVGGKGAYTPGQKLQIYPTKPSGRVVAILRTRYLPEFSDELAISQVQVEHYMYLVWQSRFVITIPCTEEW